MSTVKTLQIESGSLEASAELAQKLATNVKGQEVIELASDVGGGKTTFTSFLVQALGSQDQASSPSFTLENIYRTAEFDIHHFDFYRLEQAGVVGDEFYEVIEAADSLVIVEWAGLVANLLPSLRLQIKISSLSLNQRLFEFVYPPELEYLVKDIK